jgi:acyl-homoserine lactone acylase PvdQ
MVLNTKKNSATRFIFYFHFAIFFSKRNSKEISRLSKISTKVSIIRDNWGIAHVYGKTDADAVSGCFMPSVKTILNVLK